MIHAHRLHDARQLNSPNCSERPAGMEIDLLVIHSISLPPGQFGSNDIDALFTNALNPDRHPYFAGIAHLRVSAHLLIRRDGSMTQYVPFNKQAWHAGQSEYQGRSNCNEFSIGIELEGCDEQAFTERQYQQLARITRALLQHYPKLDSKRIVGHSEIAPGRKTDPGPCFDWRHYFDLCGVADEDRAILAATGRVE
ncbi:MAG: 1,6-anhydro-N-acetylmuramyl-L-alanine amidase AmpD [Pseudomonadales bacterium]|nr:1,6-anhydro-N-acetylmuramyl-L-alanine amidase AmpD [Pseudomonadales bacterium]